MSQQATPTQKSNLLQSLLIFVTLFLAYQLFTGGLSRNSDNRSADEVLAQMEKYGRELNDEQIAKELPVYEKKIKQEAPTHKISDTELSKKILYASVLTARTQYLVGTQRNSSDAVNKAYNTLYGLYRKYNDEPIWKESFEVPTNKASSEKAVVPEQLFGQITKELEKLNKNALVFGFFPGYQFIDTLVNLTGAHPAYSYALAALFLAIIVRALVWPLAQKTMMHSRQMTQLAPLINELKEKYQGVELNQKVMELYKTYGINPTSGCLPALVQLPLFILVYQSMVNYRFEFKNGVFLWINPNTSNALNGLTAPSLGETDYLLTIIYGISMLATSLLTPVTDIANAKQQRVTSIMVSVFMTVLLLFWPIPSAFVLYWIFTNMFTTLQSLRLYRLPLPPLMKKTGPSGELVTVTGVSGGSQFKSTGTPKVHKPKAKKRR